MPLYLKRAQGQNSQPPARHTEKNWRAQLLYEMPSPSGNPFGQYNSLDRFAVRTLYSNGPANEARLRLSTHRIMLGFHCRSHAHRI